MRPVSGPTLSSLAQIQAPSSRSLSGLTMALALTLPCLEGLVATPSRATEPGPASISQRKTVMYDDKRRIVREICPDEGWTDTFDPSTQKKLYRDLTTAEGTQRLVYDDYGSLCLPFQAALANDRDVTEIRYIRDVARRFATPESLARYFDAYFRYTYDTPDPRRPFEVGTKTTYDDYWQIPTETLRRCENGKYLGDCDDLAFLAQAILHEQGKRAVVMNVGRHAICVWIDSQPEGFIAHSICTYGYDRNGTRALESGAKSHLPTPREALQTLMYKYEKPGEGCDDGFSYTVGSILEVMLPCRGARIQHSLPLDVLINKDLYDDLRPHEHNRGDEQLSLYREAAARHPGVAIFHIEFIDALKKMGSTSMRHELEQELHILIGLKPEVATYQEDLSLLYGEQQEYTRAIHHCLKAMRLGQESSNVMMPYLTGLSPFMMDYVQEFGLSTLRESLAGLRAAIHANGYPKDEMAMMRTCFFHLDSQEEMLPLLAARAEATFRASHSVASAFSPRSINKGEYASQLLELMLEQVRFDRISDARATFERVCNIRGPSANMRDALPSLRHLPYREDTVALYRSMLEYCPNWSGAHMELVEYLHKAGRNEAAISELRKAIACCNDIPTILKDLAELPGLAETSEWPSIVAELSLRREALRLNVHDRR